MYAAPILTLSVDAPRVVRVAAVCVADALLYVGVLHLHAHMFLLHQPPLLAVQLLPRHC
jgi:hypothetical protein